MLKWFQTFSDEQPVEITLWKHLQDEVAFQQEKQV